MASKSRKQVVKQVTTPPAQTNTNPLWQWIALGAVLLGVAAIRIRLLQIPLERDEGEFAYMGQLMLQGVPPYKLAYNMKFPGIYAAYALMMGIFGQTILGIHLGLLTVSLISVVLMFLLAKRLFDPLAGILAAAALGVMSVLPGVHGTSAHATQYALPLVLGGSILLLKGIESRRPGDLFWSGLLFGLALLMKQHAATFAAFGVLYVIWSGIAEKASARRIVRDSVVMSAGAVVPFAVTCTVLKVAGVFDKFWFWTITYAGQYVSQLPLSLGMEYFTTQADKVTESVRMMWYLGALGLTAIAWDRHVRKWGVFLVGFAVMAFLSVVPGMFFRNHYWILFLPAVALLAGASVYAVRNLLREYAGPVWVGMVLAFFVALAIPLNANKDFLFHMNLDDACRTMYSVNPFPESPEIGKYIREHSKPTDLVAVIGSEPQIYFYSQRRSATGFIYTYGLMEVQPFAHKMQLDMIREIETTRPRYVVFTNNPLSWLQQEKSDTTILEWAQEYVVENYEITGLTEVFEEGYSQSAWGSAAANYQPSSPFCVYVFERKPGR